MYRNYSKEKIMFLKERYKKGDIVELLDDMDEEVNMFAGLRGEVQVVDSLGTIHVLWENGRGLGLTNIDKFKKVEQKQSVDNKIDSDEKLEENEELKENEELETNEEVDEELEIEIDDEMGMF